MSGEKDGDTASGGSRYADLGTDLESGPNQDSTAITETCIELSGQEKHEPNQQPQQPQHHVVCDPAYEVRFPPGDPEDPHNLSLLAKSGLTLLLGLLAFVGSLGSSIVAPAQSAISEAMHRSEEATVLLMALFVLGFAVGPMLWAPLSEAYGRRWGMLPAVFILGIFSIGSATSQTFAGLLATRLLGGIFGSAPVCNVTAALGDLYLPRRRGIAMALYSVCVIGGPCIGPTIGAAIVVNPRLGWRWTFYIEAIIAFGVSAVCFFLLPETYGPVLLGRRAARLRALPATEGGDPRYWHPHDLDPVTLDTVFTKHLARPLRMFFTEPIVTLVALYASFVYSLMFLLLEVYPIVFRDMRHFGTVAANLPFLALFVGAICAVGVNLGNQPAYMRAVARNGGRAVPEARLPPIVVGGCLLAAGIFWFGWTATPRVPWPAPAVAGGFIGSGFNIVFQQCLNYLIDTYGRYGASATSANTMLRSLIACGLPLVARPMFHHMGIGPASSLLGGIACLALPLPLFLHRYGPRLRAMSKFIDK